MRFREQDGGGDLFSVKWSRKAEPEICGTTSEFSVLIIDAYRDTDFGFQDKSILESMF